MAAFAFRLEFRIDDPDYPAAEEATAEILRGLALKVEQGIKMEYGDPTPIRDTNGNRIGVFQFNFLT